MQLIFNTCGFATETQELNNKLIKLYTNSFLLKETRIKLLWDQNEDIVPEHCEQSDHKLVDFD